MKGEEGRSGEIGGGETRRGIEEDGREEDRRISIMQKRSEEMKLGRASEERRLKEGGKTGEEKATKGVERKIH